MVNKICVAFLLLVCQFAAVPMANGQDTLILRAEKSARSKDEKTSKRRGEIESWRGNVVTIRSNSRSREIDGNRIVRIETSWAKEFESARMAMQKKEFRAAIPLLQTAIKDEQRRWARDIIRSELIKAYSATDQNLLAVQEFGQIIATDPETRFKNLIPLAWSSSVRKTDVKNMTIGWLDSREPLLQLIAASWHLSGDQRAKSLRILETLTNDFEKDIAALARTQLWRTELTRIDIDKARKWKMQIEQIPNNLKAGPYFILGTAQSKLGLTNEAAVTLMRIPILYSQQHDLAAAALYKCGKLLHNDQRAQEANSVWKELIRDYPDSFWTSQVDQAKLSGSNRN